MQKPDTNSFNLLFTDYSATLFAAGLILISNLLMYRLVSLYLDMDGFAQYAIIKRILSLITPLVALGIAVALPRKIAAIEANLDNDQTASYFLAALLIVLIVCIICGLFINIFSGYFSFLFFGDKKYAYIVPSLSICIIGLSLQGICYAYLRGKMLFRLASIFSIGVSALSPLVALYLSAFNIVILFWLIGIFSILASLPILFSAFFHSKYKLELTSIRSLLSYGIRRIPGDFALGGLFALPSVLSAHWVSLEEAGMVAFATSLLGIAATVMSPFSVILLPHSMRLIKAKRFDLLKSQIIKVLWACLVFSLVGILLLQLLMNFGVGYWLGNEYLKYIQIVRFIVIGIFPYSIYICLRSVLDAAFFKAVNSHNLYVSLLLFVILFYSGLFLYKPIYSVIIAFLSGLSVLGFLTYYQTLKTMRAA